MLIYEATCNAEQSEMTKVFKKKNIYTAESSVINLE